MPRGQRKRGEFDFTIWLEDGSRIEWASRKPQTNIEIAHAIRRYLVPFMEHYEQATPTNAVDPSVQPQER